MTNVTLAQATTVADTALAEGRKHGFAPLTVAVLDAGGCLVVLKREDNSSLLRPQLASAKAWGCLGMGFGGRELQRRSEKAPAFVGALMALAEGRMIPVPGGVLIRDPGGAIVGAVGISGDTSINDEICAVAGIKAAGLVPDTGDK
ncbi:MAG TPA: heme-binding protein [Stellaceae bacterium]|nr:heme-binding protein [Stellaceae bacterium]